MKKDQHEVHEEQEWLDLKGVVRYTAVSNRTAREWIHRSENPLPAVQVGRKLLVKRSELDRWLAAHAVKPSGSTYVDHVVNDVVNSLRRTA